MSSMQDGLTNQSAGSIGPQSILPSKGSMWGRLLWKDGREVVPIWITLLLAAILCLIISWAMSNRNITHIAPLYISAHTFIALCSVITGVYLFANEDENRTLHLLRNLPVPPRQIVWQKLLLGGAGVVMLACLVAAFTTLLAANSRSTPLGSESPYGFNVAKVSLLPLLYLAVASLSAMITRSYFYAVLIAGIGTLGIIAVLQPAWLGASVAEYRDQGETRWLWVALALIGTGCAVLANANHWVEEKVVTKIPLRRGDARTTLAQERPHMDSSNPLPVLLWQSWKQSRVPLACCFALTVIGWIVSMMLANNRYQLGEAELPIVKTTITLLWMVAIVGIFSSAIFFDDKRRNNFRFFQQNRERSKWLWFSRLLPFWCLALLLTAIWNFFIFDIGSNGLSERLYQGYLIPRELELLGSIGFQAASQSFVVPMLALLGVIGIGQYFSMFVRNPILSFIFAGLVSVIFALLLAYVVYVNQSIWWFVVPIVIAVYAATWWRAKSWLASSPRMSAYLFPLALPGIVFVIAAVSFTYHRANELRDIQLNGNNYAQWASGAFVDQKNRALVEVEFGSEEQRQTAAKLYQEAAKAYQGEYSLMEALDKMPWSAEKTWDFVDRNQESISKAIEASQIPVCAPFLSADPETRGNQRWALQQLALVNSHDQLLKGNLSAAKRSIDAYDRVVQRSVALQANRYESGYYGLLLAWADHPDQKLSDIKAAIAQLEGYRSEIAPTKLINSKGETLENYSPVGQVASNSFYEFGGERAFMNLQYHVSDLQADNANHDFSEIKEHILFPWEYQRLLRVAQLWKLREFRHAVSDISSTLMRNGTTVSWDSLEDELLRQHWPHVPVDEDRIGLSSMLHPSYWSIRDTLQIANWRRYALLRLGLAAHKIEHDKYPDDLLELKPYFQNGLPKTSDGLMFGWFKDGLGSDLIDIDYDSASGELAYADLIASGELPLLLPFSIDHESPLPDPIEYDNGKSGIDIQLFTTGRSIYVPDYWSFSYYPSTWNVGRSDEENE